MTGKNIISGALQPDEEEDPSKSTKKKRKSNLVVTTTGLLDYIRNVLPRTTLLSLYSSTSSGTNSKGQYVCRFILQQLPVLSRQIVLRLHCAGGSFPSQSVRNVWCNLSSRVQINALLQELYALAIIEEDNWSNPPGTVTLTEPFGVGLNETLRSFDTSPWTPLDHPQLCTLEKQAGGEMDPKVVSSSLFVTKKVKDSETSILMTPEDLERYTQEQWDAVLHFLVGSVGHGPEPPPAIVHFLLQMGLMQSDPDFRKSEDNDEEASLIITETGYDFMLQDNARQVWRFVELYLRSVEEHAENGDDVLKEALILLICLSISQVGCAYVASSSTLSRHARVMIKELSLFGLIYVCKVGKTTIFYPTQVATQLIGSSSGSVSSSSATSVWSLSSKALEAALCDPSPTESSHLAIIVQTNFQICAYTTSELHVSMLGLFCDVSTIRRLPNVVFLQMTRDSVKAAFALGIQAQQILRFLEKHTHPQLRKPDCLEPIPSNVVDQIWLWDCEQSRVRYMKVYIHEVLMGRDEYRAVVQYAREIGALAYHSDSRQQLLLEYAHVQMMQAYVRQWRAQAVSQKP
jgi:Transcription factor Tfb2/Transcription factor Tfb2 (p52) C-terminal domain